MYMDEGTIGEVRVFAGQFAPRGWSFCDGSTLPIADNEALYSILGNQYGGNGQTNFQLPNLAPLFESDGDKTPLRYVICKEGYYPTQR